MSIQSTIPIQLRLQLLCESTVVLEGATRKEIVQLLAQLLAHAVVDGTAPADREGSDETR